MVVDEIGVIKIHAPPLALWREATQKQHLGILKQKRTKRMILHTVLVTGNVLRIQICFNVIDRDNV